MRHLKYAITGILPHKALQYGFMGLMLLIDSLVYYLGALAYSLFVGLSQVQLLTEEAYQNIADRIYILVGIIGLFIMTFTLLKSMVDPDKAGQAVIKSFKSLIISIGLVILLPTIFKYAFSFQNAIIKDGVIHNLLDFKIDGGQNGDEEKTMDEICSVENPSYQVFDEDGNLIQIEEDSGNSDVSRKVSEARCHGNYILMTLFQGFFYPRKDGTDPDNLFGTKWSETKEYITRTGNFAYLATYAAEVSDSKEGIMYIFLISTAAGAFAVYVLLSFCMDLGVRVFKLAFYQIIAPIPVFLRIIPGKESYFSKWSTATLKCFLEIFVRILLIEFMVFICSNFVPILGTAFSGMGEVGLLGKAVLVLGLFAFIKQAPKLFKEALGFDGTGVKLGLRGKIEESTAPVRAVGVAAGTAVTAGVQNLTHGAQNIAKSKTPLEALGAGFKTVGSSFVGFGKGLNAGISSMKDGAPKDLKGVRSSIASSVQDITNKRDERENARAVYRAEHGGKTSGVIKGHLTDAGKSVQAWAGLDPIAGLKKDQSKIAEVLSAHKELFDTSKEEVLKQKNRIASKNVTAELGGIIGDQHFDNNLVLQNAIEQAKATGMYTYMDSSGAVKRTEITPEQIAKLEQCVKPLQDVLTEDYIRGRAIDEYGKLKATTDPTTGEVKYEYEPNKAEPLIQKLATAMKNNASTLASANAQMMNDDKIPDGLKAKYKESMFDVDQVSNVNLEDIHKFMDQQATYNDGLGGTKDLDGFAWLKGSKDLIEGSNSFVTAAINTERQKSAAGDKK